MERRAGAAMNEEAKTWCTWCDAITTLSPNHKMVQNGPHHDIIVDNQRAHCVLHGKALAAKLKEVDNAARAAKVTFYNRPAAPTPVPEEPVAVEPDGDRFDDLIQDGLNG